MKSVIAITAALLLAFPLGACERKKPEEVKQPVSVSSVSKPGVKAAEKALTLEDVNKKAVNALIRVKKLEDRAAAAGLK